MHRQPRKHGFTLIEVLIAVTVLSVGIVLVLQGLHGSLAAWDGAVERMRSAMLVQEKLEEWRMNTSLSGSIEPNQRGAFAAPFEDYRWRMTSERITLPIADQPSGTLYELHCTVWRKGHERPYAAATRCFIPQPPETAP